jgi:uncharacterized phage-associated protein
MNQSFPAPRLPEFDEAKVTEAAGIIIRDSGGVIGPMRLLKLLYLADRCAWQEWERPISFDSYASLPAGPILSTTYNIIKDAAPGRGAFWREYIERVDNRTLRLKEMPPIKRLSQAEASLLRTTVARYIRLDDSSLVRLTHTLPEYKDPGGSSLPILLPTLLEALKFSEDEIQEIHAELQAEAELDSLLNS